MADITTLPELFEDELRDMYDAEKQITKALPKVIDKTTDPELSSALSAHLQETHGQIQRLEQAFQSLDLKVKSKSCDGMEGILDEGDDVLGDVSVEAVRDAAVIASCQRVEHYEITAYGSLIAWAKILGYKEAQSLLEQNLAEEKAADIKLTMLGESRINNIASSRAGELAGSRL